MQIHMFGKNSRFVLFILISGLFFIGTAVSTHAAVKDSDIDGLTDEAEISIYFTDPSNYDTDGDSVSDGREILDKTDPLDPNDSKLSQLKAGLQTFSPTRQSLAWYIGQASSSIAFILLTLLVLNGILLTTRPIWSHLFPVINYEIHHVLLWMTIFAVTGQFASLAIDPFFHMSIVERLIPFTITRNFSSGLGLELGIATSLGALACYGVAALMITSKFKEVTISLETWRAIRAVSFLVYILYLLRGIFAGTDSSARWMMWVYALSVSLVLGLTALRVFIVITKKPLASNRPADTPQQTHT